MLAPGNPPSGFARYFPILGWLPGYQRNWLRADLFAGVIPYASACAAIAGLSIEVGLLGQQREIGVAE